MAKCPEMSVYPQAISHVSKWMRSSKGIKIRQFTIFAQLVIFTLLMYAKTHNVLL